MSEWVRLRVGTKPHPYPVAALACPAGLTTSQAEARRLIAQGAVRVDGRRVRQRDAGVARTVPLAVEARP